MQVTVIRVVHRRPRTPISIRVLISAQNTGDWSVAISILKGKRKKEKGGNETHSKLTMPGEVKIAMFELMGD